MRRDSGWVGERWSSVRRAVQGIDRGRNETGAGLIESLIAVAIVGIALVAFLAAMSTGSMAVGVTDRHVTAENLARTQMEDVMGQAYAASYSTIGAPSGYSIGVSVSDVGGRDQNEIQKLTVQVSYDTDSVTLETYRVNR